MTVKELISELDKLQPDLKVVVRGYENGFNDVVSIEVRNIVESAKAQWWDGRYQEDDNDVSFRAVEIFGDNYIPKN